MPAADQSGVYPTLRQYEADRIAHARAVLEEVGTDSAEGMSVHDMAGAIGRLTVALDVALDAAADVRRERDALEAVARASYAEGREHERREHDGSGPQRRGSHLRTVT